MAGIDALLSLVNNEGAEALTLSSGRVPVLVKAGEAVELSMPPLSPILFERFVEEIEAGSKDGTYIHRGREGEVSFLISRIDAATLELRCPDSPAGGPLADESTPDRQTGGEQSELAALVERALELEATDLFLSTATDGRMRMVEGLEELPGTRCDSEQLLELLALDPEQRERLDRRGSLDLSVDFAAGRLRANLFRHHEGLSAVLRPIRSRIRSLAELGLPGDLRELAEYSDGLVLLVGPTGSGKSSTLAALVDHLNRTRSAHILTLEDPIEFAYENDRCLIHQREVGPHVESFAVGLRDALREGPDVILLGEMRDPATIAAALTAAETGHLVLSTLHSGSAAMAVDRIIDSFPAHQQTQVRLQLASVLRAVVTQVLVPSLDSARLVPAIEKAVVTSAVAAAIREGRGHQIGTQIQTGREEGMISLELSLADLVGRGVISKNAALAASRQPDLLQSLLGR